MICAVHYDYARRVFAFKVWHESFDIVLDGSRIQVIGGVDLTMVMLDLEKLRKLGMFPEKK